MRRLAFLASGYTLALVLSHYLLPTEALPWLALGFFVLCAAAFLLRGQKREIALLLCASAAVGFLWSWGHYRLVVSPAAELEGKSATVSARVLDYAEVYDDYSAIEVRLCDDNFPRTRVLVYDYDGGFAELRPGDELSLELSFISARERGGEETDSYFSDGIYIRARLSGDYSVTGRWELSFLTFPKTLGRALKQQCRACFPEDVSHLMLALITGDKSGLYADEELHTALKTAGFMHIVAVSGMHLAFLMGLLRLFTGRRRMTAFIGLPLILVFMSMTGFTPSVVRAGIMTAIALAAPLLGRENDGPTSLSAALLVLLLQNPQAIGSIGLQLSFAAMCGIILITPRVHGAISARVGEIKQPALKRLARAAGDAFAASLGAIVFTTPLTAVYFGFVPLYSLLTNVLCLWAMSAAFMLAFPVCIAGMIFAPIGAVLGWCVAWLARYTIFVTGLISRLPYAAVYTSGNYFAWWLVFVYVVFIAAYLTKGRAAFRPTVPLCGCIMCFFLVTLLIEGQDNGGFTISALDVGQGQCIALTTDEASVIIDCGSSNFDVSAGDCAAEYLSLRGRDSVDLLVLTHFHKDHANGVARLMNALDVKRLAIPENIEQNEYYDEIVSLADRQGCELYYIEHDSYVELEGIDLTLFAPLGASGENERGLIVLGECYDFDFLITGDAGTGTEELLTSCYELPDIDLLVAGHHGSKNSTGEALLDETTPEYAFISVGYNSYGHPTPEALGRLYDRGVTILRTDLGGNISYTAGNGYGEAR